MYSYWDIRGLEARPSLGLALAGASGGGAGSSAAYIPKLLTTKALSTPVLTQLLGPTLLGEELAEGTPCWRIQGLMATNGVTVEVWIGRNDFLVRKIVSRHSTDSVVEEIHRNIQLNAEIPEEIFNPKPGKD